MIPLYWLRKSVLLQWKQYLELNKNMEFEVSKTMIILTNKFMRMMLRTRTNRIKMIQSNGSTDLSPLLKKISSNPISPVIITPTLITDVHGLLKAGNWNYQDDDIKSKILRVNKTKLKSAWNITYLESGNYLIVKLEMLIEKQKLIFCIIWLTQECSRNLWEMEKQLMKS